MDADLDVILTQTFLRLAADAAGGRVRPGALFADVYANPRRFDTVTLLELALQKENVRAVLASLEPQQEGYRRLKHAHALYRAIAQRGGWGRVPFGDTLGVGASGGRVVALRQRLVASADLDRRFLHDRRHDHALAEGLSRFQARNGLSA